MINNDNINLNENTAQSRRRRAYLLRQKKNDELILSELLKKNSNCNSNVNNILDTDNNINSDFTNLNKSNNKIKRTRMQNSKGTAKMFIKPWRTSDKSQQLPTRKGQKSWYEIINDKVKAIYSNKDENTLLKKYEKCFNPPKTLEQFYYREIFEKYYPGTSHIIPYFWMPKWCGDAKDASARTLKIYKK